MKPAKYRILIVEDEQNWIKSLMKCDVLNNLKKEDPDSVITVGDHDEAETMINTYAFDLAITDFILDNNSMQFHWRSLARSLQKQQIPIVVVSAFVDDVNLITEMINDYGVKGVFHKGQLDLCKFGKRLESLIGPVKESKTYKYSDFKSKTNDKISILHISDLHFGGSHRFLPMDGFSIDDTPKLSSLITEDIKNLNLTIDAIVISGDITSTGDSEEFEFAIDHIKELHKLLNVPIENIVTVPGNHDITWKKNNPNESASASKASYRFFYNSLYGVKPKDPERFPHIVFIKDKNLLIVGLDSSVIETPDRAGIGFIGLKQRAFVKQEIKNLQKRNPDCIIIAALHHHLLPVEPEISIPKNSKNFSLIMDSSTVLRELYELNCTAILHGHKHQPFYADIRLDSALRKGPMAIIGSGSVSSQRELLGDISKNHYNIIDIVIPDEKPNLMIEGRVYNNEKFESYRKKVELVQ